VEEAEATEENTMMGYGNGVGMGAGGWIAMMVFLIALLALVVWGVTRLLPARGPGADAAAPRAETLEEILDRRFALGDIDEETYQRQRTQIASARTARR
jgi:putative membrane protein